MSTSHLDRKELKRPDAFLERASSIVTFINENAKTFLGILALLLALGAGMALLTQHRQTKEEAANSALFSSKRQLLAAMAKAPKEGTAWEDATRAELGKVEQAAKDHKGTRGSSEAWLTLGDLYFEKGNAAKAADYYKQAADTAGARSLKTAAQHALAYAYENAQNYDAAIEQLRQVVASGEKPLKGDALMAMARNYELKGDKVKATEHYDQVVREFPNTALAKSAELQKRGIR